MAELRVGLIGTGFMGKTHAIALRAVPAVFDLPLRPVCELLVDVDADTASRCAREFCFNRWDTDWHSVIYDEQIDVVDICTPNYLHYEMAKAALQARKHVYCEKPLAMSLEQSLELARMADAAGVSTMVGFNYIKNPACALAAQIIASGELGEIVHFRGSHVEDYLADVDRSGGWRVQSQLAGLGALGDLCHIVSVVHFLLGEIEELTADMRTVHAHRPAEEPDTLQAVENEDQATMLLRFASGATGTLECSRVAWGRKNSLTYEITGTRGALVFDQEQPNELQLYSATDPQARQGFRRILLGPEHPDYAAFCCAPGHGLGFNDQKIIEIRDLVVGISTASPIWPDFAAASEVDRVNQAAVISARDRCWVKPALCEHAGQAS